MSEQVDSSYLARLSNEFGGGWNRFWFASGSVLPMARVRIGTGIIAALYFATWLPAVAQWLGSSGYLPPGMVRELLEVDNRLIYRFSPLYGLADSTSLALFIAVAIVASLLLAAGVVARYSAILTFLALLSIVHRAPMLTTPLETYLAMLLAYLSLGGSGNALSIDAWRAAKSGRELPQRTWLANLARRLLQLHVAGLIGITALSALASRVWWEGTAVWFLASQTIARPFELNFLESNAKFVNFWTHAFAWINLAFPVFIWKPLLRPIVLTLTAIIWLSMILVTGQVLYIAAVLVSLLAFVDDES